MLRTHPGSMQSKHAEQSIAHRTSELSWESPDATAAHVAVHSTLFVTGLPTLAAVQKTRCRRGSWLSRRSSCKGHTLECSAQQVVVDEQGRTNILGKTAPTCWLGCAQSCRTSRPLLADLGGLAFPSQQVYGRLTPIKWSSARMISRLAMQAARSLYSARRRPSSTAVTALQTLGMLPPAERSENEAQAGQ